MTNKLFSAWKNRVIPSKQLPKRVMVRWVDAALYPFGNEILEKPGVLCENLGFLLKRDKEFIQLGFEISHENGSVRHIMQIPTYAVVEMKEIRGL